MNLRYFWNKKNFFHFSFPATLEFHYISNKKIRYYQDFLIIQKYGKFWSISNSINLLFSEERNHKYIFVKSHGFWSFDKNHRFSKLVFVCIDVRSFQNMNNSSFVFSLPFRKCLFGQNGIPRNIQKSLCEYQKQGLCLTKYIIIF